MAKPGKWLRLEHKRPTRLSAIGVESGQKRLACASLDTAIFLGHTSAKGRPTERPHSTHQPSTNGCRLREWEVDKIPLAHASARQNPFAADNVCTKELWILGKGTPSFSGAAPDESQRLQKWTVEKPFAFTSIEKASSRERLDPGVWNAFVIRPGHNK